MLCSSLAITHAMEKLTDNQRTVFELGMEVLDAHYKPPPLL